MDLMAFFLPALRSAKAALGRLSRDFAEARPRPSAPASAGCLPGGGGAKKIFKKIVFSTLSLMISFGGSLGTFRGKR